MTATTCPTGIPCGHKKIADAPPDTFEALNEMAKLPVLSLIPGTAVDRPELSLGFESANDRKASATGRRPKSRVA